MQILPAFPPPPPLTSPGPLCLIKLKCSAPPPPSLPGNLLLELPGACVLCILHVYFAFKGTTLIAFLLIILSFTS